MRSRPIILLLAVCFCSSVVFGQRVAILVPARSDRDLDYIASLSSQPLGTSRVLDSEQSITAFRSLEIADPYNMTAAESRRAALVTGCEYFLVIRTGGLRRESFAKPSYYESFSVTYLISGRTGRLAGWWLKSFEAEDQAKADHLLFESAEHAAVEISDRIQSTVATESRVASAINIEEVPADGSPASAGLKTPIPYRRIKPDYTSTAALYDVKATVDVEADIGADGKVLATRIVRWAGFGLDESVESAVRSMNWRPAFRDSEPLAMRILLRYNFTKLDKQ